MRNVYHHRYPLLSSRLLPTRLWWWQRHITTCSGYNTKWGGSRSNPCRNMFNSESCAADCNIFLFYFNFLFPPFLLLLPVMLLFPSPVHDDFVAFYFSCFVFWHRLPPTRHNHLFRIRHQVANNKTNTPLEANCKFKKSPSLIHLNTTEWYHMITTSITNEKALGRFR